MTLLTTNTSNFLIEDSLKAHITRLLNINIATTRFPTVVNAVLSYANSLILGQVGPVYLSSGTYSIITRILDIYSNQLDNYSPMATNLTIDDGINGIYSHYTLLNGHNDMFKVMRRQDRLYVESPFSDISRDCFRLVKTRTWVAEQKVNSVSRSVYLVLPIIATLCKLRYSTALFGSELKNLHNGILGVNSHNELIIKCPSESVKSMLGIYEDVRFVVLDDHSVDTVGGVLSTYPPTIHDNYARQLFDKLHISTGKWFFRESQRFDNISNASNNTIKTHSSDGSNGTFDITDSSKSADDLFLLSSAEEQSSYLMSSMITPPEPITLNNLQHPEKLFDYQKVGVRYILSRFGTMLCDDQGLGKTLQALAAVATNELFPCVIVTTAATHLWYNAIHEDIVPEFADVIMLKGKKCVPIGTAHFYIVSWDVLADRLDNIPKHVRSLILDESHYIRNGKRSKGGWTIKRTGAVMQLKKRVDVPDGKIIALSGTPLWNSPIDLANQLTVVDHMKNFGTRRAFAERYCNGHQGVFGWDESGASNMDELAFRLRSTCMIARNKLDVLDCLPPISYHPIHLHLQRDYPKGWRQYVSAVNGVVADLDTYYTNQNLSGDVHDVLGLDNDFNKIVKSSLFKLLHTIGDIKVNNDSPLLSWLDDFISYDAATKSVKSNDKYIIFAYHISVIKTLLDRYGKHAVLINGSSSPKARQNAEQKFQQDPNCKVLVANHKSAREGLTLTASSNVIVLEMPWASAALDQCIARAYGRVNDPHGVATWMLGFEDGCDHIVYDTVLAKRELVNTVKTVSEHQVLNNLTEFLLQQMLRSTH